MRVHFLPIAAFLLCCSHDALALSCVPRSLTVDYQYKAADTIFVADLVHADIVNSSDGNRAVRRKQFRVLEVLKGNVGLEIKVIDDSIYSRVETPFVKQRELVFLKAVDNLGDCGGSRVLSEDRYGRSIDERILKKLRNFKAA
jgi:hypothetical protein